jgi:hypothetical protein
MPHDLANSFICLPTVLPAGLFSPFVTEKPSGNFTTNFSGNLKNKTQQRTRCDHVE